MSEDHTPLGASPMVAGENDPAEIARIEADIDHTRNAISGDLRTLGERLSPEQLKEDAKEIMTEAKNVARETLQEAKNMATSTFRDVKDDAIETVSAKVGELRDNVRAVERDAIGFVRDNAIPLALIGIGVAWFASNRRGREASWEGDYAPRGRGRWRYPEDDETRPLDDTRDTLSRAADATRDYTQRTQARARDWVENAERSVSDAAGQVRDFAGHEVDEVRVAARQARERVGRAASQARDTASRELRQARDFTRRATESHPLAVAAGVMVAGVCVGLVIPETDRESEWLGRGRERLLGDAQEAIQGLTDTAKETARDVKNSLTGATG